MDFLPIYYRPMSAQQQAPAVRDLLRQMLREEMAGMPLAHQQAAVEHRRQQVPEKWSKTIRLDHYQPDEVKVVVKDGTVRIHAKHLGGDELNSDVRESTRTIRIPEGVDQSKVHCYMSNENHYTVEGPMLPNEDDEVDITLEDVPAITDGSEVDTQVKEQGPYQENLDLSVFDPRNINITRKKNIVSVSANESRDEDGIKVHRSFCREFTLPEGVDFKQVKAARGKDGKVAIMAPRLES
ncbi:heat shock protein beta-1-like [Saccostrea cucullata]|uniref:heat shock protein beta-1-like n=1 Tax=Saccostrea cuccullata TaxID=36930 RepID=UPI002ED58C03